MYRKGRGFAVILLCALALCGCYKKVNIREVIGTDRMKVEPYRATYVIDHNDCGQITTYASYVFVATVTDYENYLAFQMQSDACADSLLFVFTNGFSRRAVRSFRLLDLNPATRYRVVKLFDPKAEETVMTGAELMQYGVRTEFPENQHIRHMAGLYKISAI